ncbi:unnamed protein product [Brassica rapa subsp. narinosa]
MEGMATVEAVEEKVTIVAVEETKMMIDVEEKVLTTPGFLLWLAIISEDESKGALKVFWGGSMTEALGAWVLLYRWLCEARVAATRMAKLRVDGSQSFGVALRASRFLPKLGLMDYQRLLFRVTMLSVSSFGSFQAIKPFINMVMSVVQLGLLFLSLLCCFRFIFSFRYLCSV